MVKKQPLAILSFPRAVTKKANWRGGGGYINVFIAVMIQMSTDCICIGFVLGGEYKQLRLICSLSC